MVFIYIPPILAHSFGDSFSIWYNQVVQALDAPLLPVDLLQQALPMLGKELELALHIPGVPQG